MTEEKVNKLMSDLKSLRYTWSSGGCSYNSEVIRKENLDRVEQVIRGFLLDNRDEDFKELKVKISELEAKVYAYERIISNSNFNTILNKQEGL